MMCCNKAFAENSRKTVFLKRKVKFRINLSDLRLTITSLRAVWDKRLVLALGNKTSLINKLLPAIKLIGPTLTLMYV